MAHRPRRVDWQHRLGLKVNHTLTMKEPFLTGGNKIVGEPATVVGEWCERLGFKIKQTNRCPPARNKKFPLAFNQIALGSHIGERNDPSG